MKTSVTQLKKNVTEIILDVFIIFLYLNWAKKNYCVSGNGLKNFR